MACCAFVAFLVSQIYLAVQGATHWLRGSSGAPVPSAVMWRLEQPLETSMAQPLAVRPIAIAAAASLRPARRANKQTLALLSLAVVAEATLLVGGTQWLMDGGARALMSDAQRLASVRSWADLKIICTTKR